MQARNPFQHRRRMSTRPLGRVSGTCGYPQRRNFESIRFEHARPAPDAVFPRQGEALAQGQEGRGEAPDTVHHSAYDCHGRDEAGCDAGRRCRCKAHWPFRLDGKGRGLCVRSRASTGHHRTFVCPSGFSSSQASSQDALSCTALFEPRSLEAHRVACAVRGKPHSGAHVAH